MEEGARTSGYQTETSFACVSPSSLLPFPLLFH